MNQLLDYARSNDLLELCRGGRNNPRKGNVFIADVREQRGKYSTRPPMTSDEKAKWIAELGTTLCGKWGLGTCIFGDLCHRKHVGPKGHAKPRNSQTASFQTSSLPASSDEILLHHQLRSLPFISATPKLHLLDVIYATSVLLISHLNAQLRALVRWISRSLFTPLILTNW